MDPDLFTPDDEYVDPVFGRIALQFGRWQGEVPFAHRATGAERLQLIIDAGKGRPTDAQRELFLEISDRYATLWPAIAEALALHHDVLGTRGAVEQYINAPCLELPPLPIGLPREWHLQYTFELASEGDGAHWAHFREWELVSLEGSG